MRGTRMRHMPHTRPARATPPPRPPRRHQGQRAAAARRAADARLRDHRRVRGAHGRPLAAEPRLRLPDAGPARGRRTRALRRGRRRKRFELTDAGRAWLDEHRDDEARRRRGSAPALGGRGDLRRLAGEIFGQLRQLGRFGSAAQLEQAKEILARTRTELYAVLANPPADDTDGSPRRCVGPQRAASGLLLGAP